MFPRRRTPFPPASALLALLAAGPPAAAAVQGATLIRADTAPPRIALADPPVPVLVPVLVPALVPALARDPAATADRVLFVSRGELWSAPLSGGTARRLTALGGEVSRPRISPDGRTVAFTLSRDGTRDVFSLPVAGGEPRRLTTLNGSAPDDGFVLAWTPDSRRVLFLTSRFSWARKIDRPFAVPAAGGLPEPFELDHSGPLCFDPDGHTVVLTRFMTDFQARKRYLGGMAPALFAQDLRGGLPRPLAPWRGTSTDPMCRDARSLFFLSDRDPSFRRQLWALDRRTGRTRALTRFRDGDAEAPTLGPTAIVFTQRGRLWAIDLPSERLRPIPLAVPDDGARTVPREVDAAPALRPTDGTGRPNYAVLPDGDLLLAARGALFRVSARPGAASTSLSPRTAVPRAIDEDHPVPSPDGRTLAFVSDASGTPQLALRPLDGSAPARTLTRFPDGVPFAPVWSSDGRILALPDAEHRLWLVSVADGATRLVATDPAAVIRDPAFSPDNRRLAFSTRTPARTGVLHLFDLASGRDQRLDDPLEDDHLPAFTPDGARLLFVSPRRDLPLRSDRDDATIAALDSDALLSVPLPAAPGPVPPGLLRRATVVPLPPARIAALSTRGDAVLIETRPPELVDGDLPGADPALYRLGSGPSPTPRPLLRGFDDVVSSPDGRTLDFRRDGTWHSLRLAAADAPAQSDPARADPNQSDPTGPDRTFPPFHLPLLVEPRAEWSEMFDTAWRLDRDVFLSRNTNGTDWNAVRAAYAPLLPSLGSAGDAAWLLTQLQGELATSHAFIEPPPPDAVSGASPGALPGHTPLLGADLASDPATNHIRLAHVLRGDPTRSRFRAPLDGPFPGGDVSDGDLLLAIDGHELRAADDPFPLLAASTGPVQLTLAHAPGAGAPAAARTITVLPVDDERPLRQLDHERAARARVSARSGGRLGYLFLSDFFEHGSEEFLRQYRPQLDRNGLVIDIRWNGGGDTSQFVLDQLARPLAGVFVNRERALEPLPASAPRTLELLDDAATASDGDQFAFFFRARHLGEVVGQRSWGGVQGIDSPWPLVDGSAITIPKDALATRDGHWFIENTGAMPDITVDDLPLEDTRREDQPGADHQLDVATARLLSRLSASPPAHPRAPPPLPAYPPAGNVPGAVFR